MITLLALTAKAQTFTEILCRPTNNSMTISALFSQKVQAKFEYGTQPNALTSMTATYLTQQDTPLVAVMSPLLANTRYYYRTTYKLPNANNFQYGPLRTFHTQRAPGSAFKFIVEADEHLYDKKGVKSIYNICLDNQAKDSADFMLSLGDTFGDDHTPLETTSEDMRQLHLDYREFLGKNCHSSPFFFCLGNHEGESGWHLDQTPPNNIAVYGTNWRKFYYPNPVPDAFYTGNSTVEPYDIGLPENYYAWTWGDALFVVLDVYRDCDVNIKPQKWDWTLGETQYNWLKSSLENSNAKYKFVFAHHTRGQGRGAVVTANGFEWGGYNTNGAYEFLTMRPGWAMPIHQLMVTNGVNIFFQGHDHLYAKEELDGLVYQETPMPSDSTYEIGMLANADAYTDVTLNGTGHLRVSVEEHCVTVDFVRAYLPQDTLSGEHHNGEIAYSYHVGECTNATFNQDELSTETLSVYPNPTAEKVIIKTRNKAGSNRYIELLNMQGSLLYSGLWTENNESTALSLSSFPPGIYFVRITENTTSKTSKIIKTR